MQKLVIGFPLIPFILVFGGCSKHNTPTPSPTPSQDAAETARPFLDSMVWNNLATTTYFSYRTDSLQDKITTVSSNVNDTARFEYKGRQISHISNLRLNRSSDYIYDIAGRISVITISGYAGMNDQHFRFQYGYDGKGRLSELAYYLEKATHKKLQYSCEYDYDTRGLLSKVKGKTADGRKILYTIDSYTDECNFNPWVFVEPVDPTEGFEIYNLPLLQQITRLPGKMTKTVTGDNGSFSRQLSATLQGENLSRAVTIVQYPSAPSSNYQFDVELFYGR
jgi:hypothetical protein